MKDRSNQPFESDNLIIIFNGEIYNHLELKKDLKKKGEKFKSNSDTEVLLKSYKVYGTNCVNYLEGMWSFAIFDKKKIFYSFQEIDLVKNHYFISLKIIIFILDLKLNLLNLYYLKI